MIYGVLMWVSGVMLVVWLRVFSLSMLLRLLLVVVSMRFCIVGR